MVDFWVESGYHLLDKTENGFLRVTDDFLRAYFLRPELEPVNESCANELIIHEKLLKNPRAVVNEKDISKMTDADVRENYKLIINFRDCLISSTSIEDCYLKIFRNEIVATIPPLFIFQLTQIILRNILSGVLYPLWVRAAEIMFREQKVSLQDASIMSADTDTLNFKLLNENTPSFALNKDKTLPKSNEIELDVLNDKNAELYWDRSDKYDTVVDLQVWGQGNAALCRVLELWVKHFFQATVKIHPLEEIKEEKWIWHIGLDQDSTSLLNDLYSGNPVSEERNKRLISLYKMEILNDNLLQKEFSGRPIYMGMSMNSDNLIRLKPQNILMNLPLAKST